MIRLDYLDYVKDTLDGEANKTTKELIIKLKEQRQKQIDDSRIKYEKAIDDLQKKTQTSDLMTEKSKLSYLEDRNLDRNRYLKAYEDAKKEHDDVINKTKTILEKNNEFIRQQQEDSKKIINKFMDSTSTTVEPKPSTSNEIGDIASEIKKAKMTVISEKDIEPLENETVGNYFERIGINTCSSHHGPYIDIDGINTIPLNELPLAEQNALIKVAKVFMEDTNAAKAIEKANEENVLKREEEYLKTKMELEKK